MTVVIAAACKNGIVLASDRLVVYGGGYPEYESDQAKMMQLSPRMVLGVSSSGHEDLLLQSRIRKLKSQISPDDKVWDVAELLRNEFSDLRKELAEKELLGSYGLDYGSFQEILKNSNSPLFSLMAGNLSGYRLRVQLLLAGADSDGFHIFLIDSGSNNMGAIVDCSAHSCGRIGSGGEYAFISMLLGGNVRDVELPECLYRVFEAKRMAQLAHGVGPSTDIAVIRENKDIQWMKEGDEQMSQLEVVYQTSRPKSVTETHGEQLRKMLAE